MGTGKEIEPFEAYSTLKRRGSSGTEKFFSSNFKTLD